MISRRKFQSGLIFVICGSSLPLFAAASESPKAIYRHRLRYTRQGYQLYFWMRVANVGSISSDVPFTLRLLADPQGKQLLKSFSHVSRSRASHIVRADIDVTGTSWKPGSPLYCQVIFDEANLSTKVRKLTPSVQGIVL